MINIDYHALGAILKSHEVRTAVNDLARAVAADVDVGSVTEAQVVVREYTTDRAAAAVSIQHPAGLAIEGKHGALTRAAAKHGLQVKS